MNSLNEITNIGIPCYEALPLRLYDMTLTCSDNKQKSIKVEREIRKEANSKIENAINKKSPSKNIENLQVINFLANDRSISVFDLDEKQRIVNSFSNLFTLDRNSDISSLLESASKSVDDLEKKYDYIKHNPYTSMFHKSLKNDFPLIYNGKDYNTDLRLYLKETLTFYKELLNNVDNINKVNFNEMLDFYTDTLNAEKIGLFLAYTYLIKSRIFIENENFEKAQEYLFYVSAYLKKGFDKSLKIHVNNEEISYFKIKNCYDEILKNFSNLNEFVLRRDTFIDKNLEDNKKVISSLINMNNLKTNDIFIKPGSSDKEKKISSRTVTPLTLEEEEMVITYINDKLYTFLRNNPKAKIDCDNRFSNYIAFVYENGMILADRLKGINRILK